MKKYKESTKVVPIIYGKPILRSGCRITSGMTTAYWHMAHQDRSSWTTEIDVRPFKEKF